MYIICVLSLFCEYFQHCIHYTKLLRLLTLNLYWRKTKVLELYEMFGFKICDKLPQVYYTRKYFKYGRSDTDTALSIYTYTCVYVF